MKVLFVFSRYDYQSKKTPLRNQEEIQFGISTISSLLKLEGHKTDLLVLTRKTKLTFIFDYIKKFNPEIIGFTAVSTEYKFISKVAEEINLRFPFKYLIIGGPHASLNPDLVIQGPFNAVGIGEGEFATLELVEQLASGKKPTGIKNLWIKDGSEIEKNPTRDFIQDLDVIPFPDRDMWQKWINWPNTRHSILLGRGCPFNCTFCSNHALKKLASGKYVRFRSVKNVMNELKQMIEKFPSIKEIYFEVETLGADMKFGIILCQELEKFNKSFKKKLSFGVNLRIIPKIDFEPLFNAMQKANFRFINIGIESGSEHIREKILKRTYSNKDILRNVTLARKYGLQICTYNMIGFPEETIEDFKKTIEINRKIQPDWTQLSIFFPYIGTELFNYCKQIGVLRIDLDERMERQKAILNLSSFSKRKVKRCYTWFYYYIYRGFAPLLYILPRTIFSNLNSYYLFNRLYKTLLRLKVLEKFESLFAKSRLI